MVEGTRIERQLNNAILHERYKNFLESFYKPGINHYLENLKKKIDFPVVAENVYNKIIDIFHRNNLMAHILGSKDFLRVLDAEKKLKGDAKLGTVICIDGRVSIPFQFGRIINTKEVAGSLVELNDNEQTISDRRFIAILDQSADEGRELLEIVTAHTSLRHKDHRCGAITKGVNEGTFQGDIDKIAWQEAEKRTIAIENKYNEILQAKGKPPQKKVAITAMIDTDTMGLILNFGKENKQYSTTDLTLRLFSEIEKKIGSEVGQFGSLNQSFNDPKHFIEYSKKVLRITDYLINDKFKQKNSEVKKYIADNYPDLSEQQQQALFFSICRTVANQYITGLASSNYHNPYGEHDESYMVVSPAGKPAGRFDPEQSFGSIPSNRKEMMEHVKTKISILEKNQAEKPHILFVSTPINRELLKDPDITLVTAEDAARVYYQVLFQDKEIKKQVEKGELIIIPILVDEKNGDILTVKDYSIYH